MECKFVVSQKVLCVDASSDGPGPWFGDAPKEGVVYTIRGLAPTGCVRHGVRLVYLYFHEIRRGEVLLPVPPFELGYYHTRFRALESAKRATDIRVFREILERESRRERA